MFPEGPPGLRLPLQLRWLGVVWQRGGGVGVSSVIGRESSPDTEPRGGAAGRAEDPEDPGPPEDLLPEAGGPGASSSGHRQIPGHAALLTKKE